LSLAMSHLVASLSFLDPAAPATYPLSLHDALPIFTSASQAGCECRPQPLEILGGVVGLHREADVAAPSREGDHRDLDPMPFEELDRKSTRLNSSHVKISYAVFCLKKKRRRSEK